MSNCKIIHPDVFHLTQPKTGGDTSFPLGLGQQGVHEVCEASFGDMASLTGFCLAVAKPRPGPIAWISQRALSFDHGHASLIGSQRFRHAPVEALIVRTNKWMETLWAVEEAIRSSAVSLVIAEVKRLDFTAVRRLTLTSHRHGIPVLLLLPYTHEGASTAAARWRIGSRPSAPNALDPAAPGHTRWRATLERSRTTPTMAGKVFDFELNDETLSLSLVSELAPHTPIQDQPRASPSGLALQRRA